LAAAGAWRFALRATYIHGRIPDPDQGFFRFQDNRRSCSVRLAAELLGELAEFFLATLFGFGCFLLGSRRLLLGLALLGLLLETFAQLFSGMRTPARRPVR
jgi:hypothetical protein